MAGTGPEDLHALAEELLAAAIESLDTIPTFAPALGGAPERSFISPGIPVFDCCEMLAVNVDAVIESDTSPGGLASGRRATYSRINLPILTVSIVRCIPTVGGSQLDEIPNIEDLQAAAEQIHADGWAIWNHIFNMIRAGDLFALCDEVFWQGMRAIAPSGGCGGWTASWRIQLDGYEE